MAERDCPDDAAALPPEGASALLHESASRPARLRHWARTHLVLPAVLYFALMVSIWYVATHSEAWVRAGSIDGIRESEAEAVALSSDGARLSVLNGDGGVSLWDTRSGRSLWTMQEEPSGAPRSLHESTSSYVLGIIEEPLYVLAEDKRSGERRVVLFPEKTQHLWRRSSVVFSPDGKLVAVGRPDGTVSIRDAVSGSVVARIAGHAWTLGDACFSPDGTMLATTNFDREAALWDARTGECRRRIRGYDGPVFSACFSPDGCTLVTGGHCGEMRLISVTNGTTLGAVREHEGPIVAVAFSHDGCRIASASDDEGPKALQIRDADSLELLGSDDLGLPPLRLAFTTDGRSLPVVFACFLGGEMTMPVFVSPLDDLSRSELVDVHARRSAVSADGQTYVGLWGTGWTMIWCRRRPEQWWGVFWLPAFWAAVAVAGAFAAALARDVRYVRRVRREGRQV